MTRPLVSIALATHNGLPHLTAQLETLFAQTWAPLEIVVSDDASSDGTWDLLRKHASANKLRAYRNPHRLGLVKNFEKAIARCKGEYIALCDQDDLWRPTKIEVLVANGSQAELVYCNDQEYLSPSEQVSLETRYSHIVKFALRHGSMRLTKHLLAENWIVSHTLMFKRHLFRWALPIPQDLRYHDGWIALVASACGEIRFVNKRLQTYRQHVASYTAVARTEFDAAPRQYRPWRRNWFERCAAEQKRLDALSRLTLLNVSELSMLSKLRRYYSLNPRPPARIRATAAGLQVAPYFVSLGGLGHRLRFALRPLAATGRWTATEG
ncbi:MAG TPA: glycosyltransferase [Thermoanaerobaculia bacterium]|nr:glycosyltransferase [Thermoanaerobaculia bacterium]